MGDNPQIVYLNFFLSARGYAGAAVGINPNPSVEGFGITAWKRGVTAAIPGRKRAGTRTTITATKQALEIDSPVKSQFCSKTAFVAAGFPPHNFGGPAGCLAGSLRPP